MNILFISHATFPQGMASTKRIRLFAEYFVDMGCNVNVFILGKNNGNNKNSGSFNEINYKLLKLNIIHYLLGIRKIYKILNDHFFRDNKNIIYLYDSIGIYKILIALIAKYIGYKIITDIIEDHSLYEKNLSVRLIIRYRIDSMIDKYILNYIDGIITVSKYLQEKYIKLGYCNNVQLIPISASNLFYKAKKKCKTNNFRFTSTGSFDDKDGIKYLIKSFIKLSDKYSNIELVLTGIAHPSRKKKYLYQLHSKYNINHVGFIPDNDYYDFLNGSDVLLMTRIDSKYANAGFPFKLGEYLATGKPVIATNSSDVNLYLSDKNDIILSSPSDSESLFKAMEYALLNPKRCFEIGQNGRKAAFKYFNPKINSKLLQIFLDRL